MEQEELQIQQEFNLHQQGGDEMGTTYKNINDMWEKEIDNKNTDQVNQPIGGYQNWYNKAAEYWENVDASVNGVLGGFEQLDAPDIKHSHIFIDKLFKEYKVGNQRSIDMGAGIGRVSKGLLCKRFKTVDIVDQCGKYVEKAKEYLKGQNVGHFITSGLQNIELTEQYDCIWVQWVTHHLTDKDFIEYLIKCKKYLKPNGVIVVKENHTKQGFLVDKEDYSVTRCESLYREIFEKAGLEVRYDSIQTDFPKELFKVKAYALFPKN